MADTQKKVIISVGADTSELNNKIDEAQGKLGNLGNTDVGAKSVKSLKQELREATIQAQQLAAAGDDGSEAYARAVKRVAELKDAQDRVNRSVQTFDPGNKLSGLVQIAQGGAVAIQGIAGALTAVGVESETAQVAIARLQGIMAFTSALSQIDDIKEAFSDLSKVLGITSTAQKSVATSTSVATTTIQAETVATEGATVATNAFRTALAAVGIGIIIAALAAAVEAFQSFKSAATLAKEAQDDFNKSQLTGARAQLEGELASINRTGEELLAQARVRGASAVELAKIEQDTAELTAKARKRYLDNIKGVGGDIARAEQDLNDAIGKSKIAGYKVQEVTNAQKLKNQAEYNSKALELQKQNEASLKEIQKNEEEAQKTISNSVLSERDIQIKTIAEKYRVQIDLARQFKKDTAELEEARRVEIAAINAKFDAEELDALKKKQEEEKAAARTVISKSLETNTLKTETTLIDTQINNQADETDTVESRISKLDAIYQAERELKRVQFEQELFELEGNEAAISNLKAKYRQQELADEEANTEAKKALYEAEKQQRIQTIGVVSNSLKSFSALAGEQTVAGKALGIASATIDTYQSAVSAYKSVVGIPYVGPFIAPVMAGAAIAAGIANIKKMAAIQVPGKGGSGGAGVSAPSLSNISAPVINAAQLNQQNTVQNVRVTNQDDLMVRAVITDKDLKDNDNRREFRNSINTL